MLTYVFVGGGYAGLEALAELQDFASDAIARYPQAKLHGMRWIVVEAQDRVLTEVDQRLADYALRELRGRGIDVRLGTTLEELTATSARLSTGETIPTKTLVWTAGVVTSPSASLLGLPLNEQGRIEVDDHMRVAGRGRRVRARRRRGGARPGTQGQGLPADGAALDPPGQGRPGATSPHRWAWAARAPFTYKAKGQFVNLGRYKAVAMAGPLKVRGFIAWWMARTYHMSQIPGLARKVRAVVDWTVGLPFRRDTAEVGSIGHPSPLGERRQQAGSSEPPA